MKWTLREINTSGGYLFGCPIAFTPGLNCIIGARGTCKSTVVETIRFVFDCEPDKVDPMIKPRLIDGSIASQLMRPGLLVETLAGGTAKCTITAVDDPSQSKYVVERNVPSAPRIYKDGVQQIDETTILHNIEIFSQGDLQTIAEIPDRRLALIDRPNQRRVDEVLAKISDLTRDLVAIGPSIRQLRGEIDSLKAKVQTLAPTRQRLEDLQSQRPSLSPELEAERLKYNSRVQAFERLKMAEQAYARGLAAVRALSAETPALHEAAEFARSIGSTGADRMAAIISDLVGVGPTMRTIAERNDGLGESLAIVASEFETMNARYYELRKNQQSVNDALKTEESLRQAVVAMEAVAAELEIQEAKYAQAMARRRDLRSQRDAMADELYSMRSTQSETINADFGDQIVLTLEQGVLTAAHRKLVEELLYRSNIRNQPEVARDVAEKIRPSDLIDVIEEGDAKRLAELLGRDLGQMTRMVSHLLDNPRLYELEGVVPKDNLEITMMVRGEAKPIEKLSKGQKATALLPLILREADYPLIIDQPEDDLDNAFISEKLIERLKAISGRRQLIFVTHNANIPVLGEADSVVVMEMRGPRETLPCKNGTVDEMKTSIINLLEGGKDAFNSRQAKYGPALR